ncbi:MAG: EF-Tu/IF-2/RF-3 family GTPase [Candidatus ainarchaeum sp.]|nr:EF-Tu/IF-2/RF-3 family GTPase [Candidatus ainarchaeum sp.]
MKGIRVLSLLDAETNAKIGKKGAPGDFTIYMYKQGDIAVEVIEPTLYPEKIHPLVFGLALSDFVLFRPDTGKKEFPELLASFIIAGKPGAFVGDKGGIENYIKATALEKWETLDEDPIKMRERLLTVQNGWKEGKTKIIVDQVFSLKSIGVVVLGAIERGTVRVHDEMALFPSGQKIQVKSLQLHDENVSEITDGSRVGANIKGAEAESIERGFVLGDGMLSGKKFRAELECPKFVKEGIQKGRKVFAYVGLQFAEASVSEDVPAGAKRQVEIECERDFAYEKGDDVFIVDPGRKPRVLGAGVIS